MLHFLSNVLSNAQPFVTDYSRLLMLDSQSAALPDLEAATSQPKTHTRPGRAAWLHLARTLLLMLAIGGLYLGASWWMDGHPSQAALFRYADTTARMTVDDVHALGDDAFEAVTEMQSPGYSGAAFWFRLQRPASAEGGRQVLLVQPSYVDDVRFYLPDQQRPGRWIETQQGDHSPFSQRQRDELGFAVNANVEVGQWMYVRVKSSSAVSTRVRLLDEADSVDEDTLTVLGVGIYAGGVLLLAIGSVMSAVARWDRFWAFNALFQVVTAVAAFMYFGLGNRFLWPQQPGLADQATNMLFIIHFLCGSVFYRAYANQHAPPQWMLRMVDLMVLLQLTQLVMVASGMTQAGFSINLVLVPLGGVIAASMYLGLRTDDGIEQFLLRLNMLGIFVYFVVFFPLHHQFIEATFMLLYPGLYLNALTAVVVHLTLLRRNTLLAHQREWASRALEQTRQRIMNERLEREEDGRFLSMLLHEVRSPLTVIAMALGTLKRRMQAVDGHDEPLRRDLQRIDASIRQMKGLFSEVEHISEIEHHKKQGALVAGAPAAVQPMIDAHHLLSELITEFRQQDDRLDITGWTDLLASDALRAASVNCGLPLVSMMMRNLVSNALKYSPQDATIVLQAHVATDGRQGARQLHLGVVNPVGAAGLPDAHQLFKKYYRAEDARGFEGSGLGLYWVRGMAHILNGDITYDTQGCNIRFSLVLPLHVP